MTEGPPDNRATVIDYLVSLGVLRSAPTAEYLALLNSEWVEAADLAA
jgi:hypothetical protein